MTAPQGIGIAEVKGELLARVPDIVHRLVPNARRSGNYWQAPNPTRAEKSDTSFTVWSNGAWKEYDDADAQGDIIGLIAYCGGRDPRSTEGRKYALAWAKDFLGLERMSAEDRRAIALKAKARAEDSQRQQEAERERRRRRAFDLWLKADPIRAGTPPLLYMRERAIDFLAIPNRIEGECRWLASARHWKDKVDAPAIVWPIRINGSVMGVHLTFLEQHKGVWRKLSVASPRLMLGEKKGGVVLISHGPSGMAPRAAAEAGRADPLVIGEGWETMCSLAETAAQDARVWAALDLGNIAAAPLDHACISKVFVAVENDIKTPAVRLRESVFEAIERRRGAPAIPITPPHGSDFNDTARG